MLVRRMTAVSGRNLRVACGLSTTVGYDLLSGLRVRPTDGGIPKFVHSELLGASLAYWS